MTDEEIIGMKRMLTAMRLHRFGPMPEDKAEWLRQMDECAASIGEPNVYRKYGSHPLPKRRHAPPRAVAPRNRFPDE